MLITFKLQLNTWKKIIVYFQVMTRHMDTCFAMYFIFVHKGNVRM